MPGEEVRVQGGVCGGMYHGYVLIFGSLYTVLGVSNHWSWIYDGTMGAANSCGAVIQGCASYYVSRLLPHHRGRMSKSMQCWHLLF